LIAERQGGATFDYCGSDLPAASIYDENCQGGAAVIGPREQ
jgi:hypothetical protein